MKAKRAAILFLTLCLTICSVLCLSIAAEDADATAKQGGLSTGAIVSLCIGGALILVAAVFCVVKRQKLKESLRSYKSELKKITWFPKKQVWTSTVFVIISVLAIALLVGLLDYAFFQGQHLLTGSGVKIFGGK